MFKGVGAETTNFSPVPDFVVLYIWWLCKDLSFQKSKFHKNMLKINCSMSIWTNVGYDVEKRNNDVVEYAFECQMRRCYFMYVTFICLYLT